MEYFVYTVDLSDAIYIGCTNNLKRRKQQHNENARKRHGKFGEYLNDNDIILDDTNFKVIYSSNDRHEALVKEKEIVVELEKSGRVLLNDNYTSGCSRKGKNIGKTSKEFVVVDVITHTCERIKNLRQHCIRNGVDYRNMHSTLSGDHLCGGRYKLFDPEEWEAAADKEFYLSGDFILARDKRILEDQAKRQAKSYIVQFPDKHTEVVTNLDKFAKSRNLSDGTLHATLVNGHFLKGYRVLRRVAE